MSAFLDSGNHFSWFYDPVGGINPLESSRGKRCCSCSILLRPGANVLTFHRFRYPKEGVELQIYKLDETAEVPIASWYMCETCAILYHALNEQLPLHLSIDISKPMIKAVKEYKEKFGELRI